MTKDVHTGILAPCPLHFFKSKYIEIGCFYRPANHKFNFFKGKQFCRSIQNGMLAEPRNVNAMKHDWNHSGILVVYL